MAAPDFQPDLSASPEPARGCEIFASLLAWMLPWHLSQPVCVSPHRLPQWKGSRGSLGWNWPSPSSIFKLMRGLTPNHVLDLDLDALWGLWVECFRLIAAQTAVNNHRVLGSPFCPPSRGFSWVSSSCHEKSIRDGVSSSWVPVTCLRASCKTWEREK